MNDHQETLAPEYWIIALSLSAALIGLVLPFSRVAGITLAVLWCAALTWIVIRSR